MNQSTVVNALGFLSFVAMLAVVAVLLWINFAVLYEYGTEPLPAALIGFGFVAACLAVVRSWMLLIASDAFKRAAQAVASRFRAE